MEDLRWYTIREIGRLHEAVRANGKTSYGMRLEFDIMKAQLAEKADVHRVQTKFQEDNAMTEARFSNMNELLAGFGGQVQEAFNQVAAIETSFRTHVSQGFEEAVNALQWLNRSTEERFEKVQRAAEDRFEKVHSKISAVEIIANTGAAYRNVPSAPAGGSPDLSGCAAGPFAMGCGTCGCGAAAPMRSPPGVSGHDSDGPGRWRTKTARDDGECHCVHVTELQEDVVELKQGLSHIRSSFGARPFILQKSEAGPGSGPA